MDSQVSMTMTTPMIPAEDFCKMCHLETFYSYCYPLLLVEDLKGKRVRTDRLDERRYWSASEQRQ